MSSLCPNEEVIRLLKELPLVKEAFVEKAEAYVPAFLAMLNPPIAKIAPLMKELVGDEVVRRITRPEEFAFASEEAKKRFVEGAYDTFNVLQLLREAVQCTDPTHGLRQLGKLPDQLTAWLRDTLNNVRVNPALLSDILSAQEESQQRYRTAALAVLPRLAQIIWSVFGDRVEELRALFLQSAKGDEDALHEYYISLCEGRSVDLEPINVMRMPARCSEPTVHALLLYLAFGDQKRFGYQACPLLYQNARCTNYAAHMMLDMMTAPHGHISLCLISPSYLRQFEELLKWASSADEHEIEWAFPALLSLNRVKKIVVYFPMGNQFYQEPSDADTLFMFHDLKRILKTYCEEWFEDLKAVVYGYSTSRFACVTQDVWGTGDENELSFQIYSRLKVSQPLTWNPFLPYVHTPPPPEASSSSSSSSETNFIVPQETSPVEGEEESVDRSKQQKRRVEEDAANATATQKEEESANLRRSKRQRRKKVTFDE